MMQKGFTLLEIVIAMAIFSIFILASVGSFIAIAKVHQRAILERKALDSARLFIDDFTRATQVADPDKVGMVQADGTLATMNPGDCTNGIIFYNRYLQENGSNVFSLVNGAIQLTNVSGTENVTDSPSTGSGFAIKVDPLHGECADDSQSLFKLVQSSGRDAQEYVRLRFQVVQQTGNAGQEFQINGGKGMHFVTTVNLRTSENR